MSESSAWSIIGPSMSSQFGDDDDPELWRAVVSKVYFDAELLANDLPRSATLVTECGRCSHWLRPHQTRWTADGGFAWPTGYGGRGYSRVGLPEFDWSVRAIWNSDSTSWAVEPKTSQQSTRQILFRVAVPSRTMRHAQAAVHTIWRPGPPQHPRQDLLQFYGFRNQATGWEETAYFAKPNENAYELAGRAV